MVLDHGLMPFSSNLMFNVYNQREVKVGTETIKGDISKDTCWSKENAWGGGEAKIWKSYISF